MSALPMAVHYQHMGKHFVLSVQLYCSTAYKNSSHQSILTLHAKKNVTEAHTLLYSGVHGPPF